MFELIELDIEEIKRLVNDLEKKVDIVLNDHNLKSKFCSDLSGNSWVRVDQVGSVSAIVANTGKFEGFYTGSVAIARGVKKPSAIVRDLIENLTVSEKQEFLSEIAPYVKKFIKDQQDWEDFKLTFAEKIRIPLPPKGD